jgi:GntR family transcriptional regulator, rspAB operon transcriptional repressor
MSIVEVISLCSAKSAKSSKPGGGVRSDRSASRHFAPDSPRAVALVANTPHTSVMVRPPPLDRSRHAAPQIVEYLREQIIALELPPGVVLARNDLAAQFGLSQTPVRDALMRLEEEGLIEVFAQHKTVISRVDIGSALQAHFLRRSIEIEIGRTLAQAQDLGLEKRLRMTIRRQKALLDTRDYQGFAAIDQMFHRQMYEAANVPELWSVVRRQSGHIDRLRRMHLPLPGKAAAILRDHARIVDAIARHDPDAAERRIREHLSGTLSRVEEIRVRYPTYVTN